MGTGKATRRAVLVVGGVALLTGYWKDPAEHANATAQARPVPVHPSATPRSTPARPRPAGVRPHRGQRHQGRHGHPDEPMFYIHDGRKRVALTIDDGPSPEYTPQVLRLLEKYRVTATFSMLSNPAQRSQPRCRRLWCTAL